MLEQLPPPPPGHQGYPWTEGSATLADFPQLQGQKLPKISIVTPSFNQGQFIEQTLRSLLLQNYPHLELIVIDGGSKDQTVSILQKYSPWLHYWVSEPDGGQSQALNKGLSRSTGEWFNWINSDDYLVPNALWHLAEQMVTGRYEVLAGKVCKFVEGFHEVIIGPSAPPKSQEEALFWFAGQPSIFVHLPTYAQLGPINESLRYRMDVEWHLRHPLHRPFERIGYLPQVLSYSNLHNECKTASQALGFHREWMSILRDLAQQAQLSTCLILQHQNQIEFSASYNSMLKIEQKINAKWLENFINTAVQAILDDPSSIYRNAAYHLLYQGVAQNSLPLAWQAVKQRPFKLQNWRCWWYARRMAKAQGRSAQP